MADAIIRTENLSYVYSEGTPYEHRAIDNVNIEIEKGSFVGLIGHTGSGKSTLIQHLNGLIKPTSGKVFVGGEDIWENPKEIRKFRFKVGLVFQYPEHQLFEETVYKDIAFGPKNMGLSENDINRRVREAAKLTGLTEEYLEKSPFELSGGEKRRVAIAGVLAMQPEVLILDEPTAGLDPKQRIAIRNYISKIAFNKIVLIATHVVSDIEFIAKDIIMLKKGVIVDNAPPHELVKRIDGQVWLIPCAESEVQAMQDRFRVTNIARDEQTSEVLLRVLAETMPTERARTVAPTLEDYYLYVFGDVSGK